MDVLMAHGGPNQLVPAKQLQVSDDVGLSWFLQPSSLESMEKDSPIWGTFGGLTKEIGQRYLAY